MGKEPFGKKLETFLDFDMSYKTKSIYIIICNIIFITIPYPIIATGGLTKIVWILFCVLSFAYGIILSIDKRPCGHGLITQWKLGFFVPFVIRKCPKCHDDLFK